MSCFFVCFQYVITTYKVYYLLKETGAFSVTVLFIHLTITVVVHLIPGGHSLRLAALQATGIQMYI